MACWGKLEENHIYDELSPTPKEENQLLHNNLKIRAPLTAQSSPTQKEDLCYNNGDKSFLVDINSMAEPDMFTTRGLWKITSSFQKYIKLHAVLYSFRQRKGRKV